MAVWHDFDEFRLHALPEGTPFDVRHVLHLGRRAYLHGLLTAAARSRYLKRLDHGVYVKPYRFHEGEPDAAALARLRLERSGEIVATHGADAARSFGIPAPEPESPRFYTSARTRTIRIGTVSVTFRHAPGVALVHAGTAAGDALAALHYLGSARAEEVGSVVRGLREEERARVRARLGMLPVPIVAAWLRADRDARVPFPPAAPRGERRERPYAPLRRRRGVDGRSLEP